MVDERAFLYAQKLVKKHKTRDPFVLADELDIEILFRNDFKRQKGAF